MRLVVYYVDVEQPHSDNEMAYLVELWTNTEATMPSVKQLQYLLHLCDTRRGVDLSFWQRDTLTRRDIGAIINALTKLPRR